MTLLINFNAEHAFLSFIKHTLDHPFTTTELESSATVTGTVAALACAGALEAIVNRLLEHDGRLRHYDELRLKSKIETVSEFGGTTINWGETPWQEITRLIRIRNWLAHNKVRYIGIDAGKWIADENFAPIKWNPLDELSPQSIRKFYDAVRQAGILLSTGIGEETAYEFLQTEVYVPILTG